MPNIENLKNKPFTKETNSRLLQAKREEILYREDLQTGFVYAIAGISISLATAGIIYVVGKKLIA